jgi:Glycine rich protein
MNFAGNQLRNEIYVPGTWTQSGSSVYYSQGNVGIGTATPSSSLYVYGNIYASNSLSTINVFSNTLTVSNSAAFTGPVSITGNLYASNALTTTNIVASNLLVAYGSPASIVQGSNVAIFSNAYGGSNVFVMNSLGQVGIGTASPSSALQVSGTIASNGLNADNSNFTGTLNYSGVSGSVFLQPGIYTFNVSGATGQAYNWPGTGYYAGGNGRYISFKYKIVSPIVLKYVIGGFPIGQAGYSGSGGGATYLYDSTNSRFICVAGGGGGGGYNSVGQDATSTATPGAGGGGNVGAPDGGGGGGGITGDGAANTVCKSAKSFANGSAGGVSAYSSPGAGGFGGGGYNGGGLNGGGGGGYTGGDGGSYNYGGSGGTSYIISGATLLLDTTTIAATNGLLVYYPTSFIDNLTTNVLTITSNILVGSGGVFSNIIQGSNVVVFSNVSGGTNVFVMNSLGKVGIGTASPGSLLSVYGTTTQNSSIAYLTDSVYGSVSFVFNSSAGAYNGLTTAGDAIVWFTKGSVNTGCLTLAPHNFGSVGIRIASTSNTFQAGANTFSFVSNTSGTAMMTILGSGNVGIGMASPGAPLDVNGNARVKTYLEFAGQNSYPQIRMRDASAGQIIFYDNPDPDSGIYNYMLNMDSGRFSFNFSTTNSAYDTGTTKAYIDYTGVYNGTGVNTLINLNGASAQSLNIGQTAYYDTGSSTSTGIALNINCGDNQCYEILVLHKGTTGNNLNYDIAVYPNNTTYSGQFNYLGITCSSGVAFVNNYYNGSMQYFWFDDENGSVYPPYIHKLWAYTGTTYSYPIVMNLAAGGGGTSSSYGAYNFTAAVWNQTSTRWTSLGTINVTGGGVAPLLILVTRVY